MQTNPFARNLRWILAVAALLTPSAHAEEPPLRELLRDGLYAEEVTRDSEAAAKHYEQVLARYSDQRAFAASALFRLAEVRRKQDRKDDAIQLYQRLLVEFPDAAVETKLARENLAALGGKVQEVNGPVTDPESQELARLESLAKNAPDIILDPATLEQAASNGWSKVVAYLLTAGSRSYAGDALRNAAEKGYLEIVRQLTAGDTPVPADVATAGIQAAIKFNRYTILDFLLQRGFKPGEMTRKYDDYFDSSALCYALLTGSPTCAEILLKYGADLDATSEPIDEVPQSGGTALQLVITVGKFDAANWLLDKGAKPDIPSRGVGITPLHEAVLQPSDSAIPLMQRLLEAGADPNRRTADHEFSTASWADRGNATPLSIAVRSVFKSTEKVRLLLKHGADPKSENRLIQLLVQRNQPGNMECLKLLVDAGAKPDDAWMKDTMARGNGEVRDFLVEKFTIPGFANDSEIQLVIDGLSGISASKIAVRSGESDPPDLGSWLLANHQNSTYASGSGVGYQWLLWRKGDDGVLVKQELDFSGSAPLPPLQWGDVVACRIFISSGSGFSSSQNGLPFGVLAVLRKRVATPITFEIDGKTREIIVRGDRAFFDPTKNEVPLKPLQQVVEFFWMSPVDMETLPIIHVSRKGWPDIRLSYNSKEAEKFELEAGDRVKLEIPDQINENLDKARRQFVTLKVEGYPFVKSIGVLSEGKAVASSIPTLMQALVDTQVPWWSSAWMKTAANPTVDMAKMAEEGAFAKFTLLPHPDLANLRIRRLMEDGVEKVIEVNLAKFIEASTGQTAVEEARKADVMLQPGDVVEISLLKDRLGEPWRGFSAQEESFFAKALSGRVRVTDEQGNITVRDLLYKAPRFIETECGWIPLPPESGIASIRGVWLIPNGSINLKRGDYQSGDQQTSGTFIRDGDEIQVTTMNLVPRQRVVPPQLPPQPQRTQPDR